jgi:hypothetical protein
MNQRLTVVPARPRHHPNPPEGLAQEQAQVWRETVAALPPERFEKAPELVLPACGVR